MGVVALYIFRVITWADANKTPAFQFIMLLGGGFLIANLLIDTKAADWAAAQLFSLLNLHGASTLTVLLVVMFVVQYLHIPFMGTTKMGTMIMPIVIGLAATANMPAVALAMPAGMLIGGYPLFLFYNTIPNLLVYGTNELQMSDFPKVGFLICTVAIIVYALVAMTYWRWLGLF
jgi:di/tricarboxylate transporter